MKTAYPQVKGTCHIRLYSNIPFDNTYQHHSLISTLFTYGGTQIYNASLAEYGEPKERFINRKKLGDEYYYPRYDLTGEFNFNFSNGLIASVVLELTPAQTNANYLRLTCGQDVYYYFITGISQNNFETYTLSLELDVVMTYQDEFLRGMLNHPAMTDRKHCHRYTNDGLAPHCADLKTGDSIFSGVKPSVIKDLTHLEFQDSQLNKLKGIYWLYICVDTKYLWSDTGDTPSQQDMDNRQYLRYKYKDVTHPLSMIVLPTNGFNTFKITNGLSGGSEVTWEMSLESYRALIDNLVGSGFVHSCKLSPYPPFTLSYTDSVVIDGSNNITITTSNITRVDTPYNNSKQWNDTKNVLFLRNASAQMVIVNEKDPTYNLTSYTLPVNNSVAPTIDSDRYLDPKLLFNPFRKYLLSAPYSQGNELYPEIGYSDGIIRSNTLSFNTLYTGYIGDNNVFTYQNPIKDNVGNVWHYEYYKENNIGVSSVVNYIIPVGENALDVFKATQSNAFYQSKNASGITAGLTIAGGIGSIALGVAGVLPTQGASTMLVASGATAIAGGIASLTNTIKSANAKIEDLKNTPDSINVQGGAFTSDVARTSNLFPYVCYYDVTDVIKEQANDFFYNYGYQVARECYFNRELEYDNDVNGIIDTNLFGRTIFNYIKLNDDITNKIDNDIPLIIKQKLNKVFNQGITLWSFFGNPQLWGSSGFLTLTDPNKWFLKCELDNTEYSN